MGMVSLKGWKVKRKAIQGYDHLVFLDGLMRGSRTKTPRQKPPGHKPPDKNPLDKNPLAKNPPDKNPPDKTFFSEILQLVFRMSYGKEISIWFLAVKYIRHGSIKYCMVGITSC